MSVQVDLWVDVACPWCYIGRRRLDLAVAESPDAVDINVHTFVLDPEAPKEPEPITSYLANKFRVPVEQARAMEERVASLARADGLAYDSDRRHADTFDALRLLQWGGRRGHAYPLLALMQNALFGGRADALSPATLAELAEEAGLPRAEAAQVLAGDDHRDDVLRDHEAALELGARGVPFTVLGNRFALPGAGSVDNYRDLIARAASGE